MFDLRGKIIKIKVDTVVLWVYTLNMIKARSTEMKAYEIILQQLGGRQFIAMTGARLFNDGNNKLIAKIKGSKTYNHIEIEHNSLDLYNIRFCKIGTARTNFEMKKDDRIENIYSDMMKGIIEEKTGLYLSL